MWDDIIPSNAELQGVHGIYLFLGLFTASFGLVSLIIKDYLFMSEAFVAALFGVIVGPNGINVFRPSVIFGDSMFTVLLELSRLVIAVQCMAAGISTPGNYVWKQRYCLAIILGPIMLCMFLVSGLGIKLILGYSWVESMLIGACITPTDPVLANSIVKGNFASKHIPLHVRLLLSAESAANDGLGLTFLYIPLYLSRFTLPGNGIGYWILNVVIYQVLLSVLIGALIGTASRYFLFHAQRRNWIDKESLLGFSIALALIVCGTVSLLGSDDILACYAAGLALSWDSWINEQISESHIQGTTIFN